MIEATEIDIATEIGGYSNHLNDVYARSASEIHRLRSQLSAIRSGTIEECAKVADEYEKEMWGFTEEQSAASNIAKSIRALSKTPGEK